MTNTAVTKANLTKTKLTKAAAALVLLSLSSGAALAFGAGGGAAGAVGVGVANPYKYYPVCPRGRADVGCQCRIGSAEDANVICRPGEYCDTRNGTCAAGVPLRTR